MALGKALLSSFSAGLAFASEVFFFHFQYSNQTLPTLECLAAGSLATGLYLALKGARSPWQVGGLLLSVFSGALECAFHGCRFGPALIALVLTVLYPRFLRRHPFTKPLAIAGAWIAAMAVLIPSVPGSLALQQGILVATSSLPFDISTCHEDNFLSFPRRFGLRTTRYVLYALTALYSVIGWIAHPTLRGSTLLTGGVLLALLQWPGSMRWPFVLLYDGLFPLQAFGAVCLPGLSGGFPYLW